MRTTVNIDDRLLSRAKQSAVGSGRTLSDLVNDGLRLQLALSERRAPTAVALPVFGGSGLRPGVDLEHQDDLASVLGDGSTAHAAG